MIFQTFAFDSVLLKEGKEVKFKSKTRIRSFSTWTTYSILLKGLVVRYNFSIHAKHLRSIFILQTT